VVKVCHPEGSVDVVVKNIGKNVRMHLAPIEDVNVKTIGRCPNSVGILKFLFAYTLY
jgi:hypothetical protein